VGITENLCNMDTDWRIKLRIGYEELDWISLAEDKVQ
jgi:hypothetical protein